MNRKKLEDICIYMAIFIFIGGLILINDEDNVLGILFMVIGFGATILRGFLNIYDSMVGAKITKSAKKEFVRETEDNTPLLQEDIELESKISKIILERAKKGISSIEDQKELIESLVKLVPKLSVLTKHPAIKQVEDGVLDNAHGVGQLITVTEYVLSKEKHSLYYSMWSGADDKTLLDSYLILDFYMSAIIGSAPGIRTAKHVIARILAERLPHIEKKMEEKDEDELYDAEHPQCKICNAQKHIDDMLLVNGNWICKECYNERFEDSANIKS